MKIHLIQRKTVKNYTKANVQSRSAFVNWLSAMQRADWKEPKDIISTFNSADILGQSSKRVVFNIGGNKYRIICSYCFGKFKVHLYIKWIGTHAEYSKLCAEGKQYTISNY